MRQPHSSFVYKKALCQQEKGGETYRVVTGVIKHCDGRVEQTPVMTFMNRNSALRLGRELNSKNPYAASLRKLVVG